MEENKKFEEPQEIKWGGILNEFLWICAGANRKVLRQCPTKYAKYAGIGGTILFTALMAMLSGGYAMFTVFKSTALSVGFGIFWGLLIFNLDRFIVNTMYSDGKVTISWQEFVSGLPRIIIAIFLGIVISSPLELKIFEDEIEGLIEEIKLDKVKEYVSQDQAKVDSINFMIERISNEPISEATAALQYTGNQEYDRLVSEIKDKENLLAQARQNEQYAWRKYSQSSTHNDSINWRTQANKYNRTVSTLNNEISQLKVQAGATNQDVRNAILAGQQEKNKRVEDLRAEKTTVLERMKNVDNYSDKLDQNFGGFQARMLAFNRMKDRENDPTWICSLFITLLFIIIETAPTFFKMMIASGPYDDYLRAEMHRVKILSQKRISDINDQVNTSVQISTEQNKNRLEAEVLANKMLLEKIAAAQSDILSEAIELWRKEELEKVQKDPSVYINSSKSSNFS